MLSFIHFLLIFLQQFFSDNPRTIGPKTFPPIWEERRVCSENYNVRTLSDKWVCVQCRFQPDERFFLMSPDRGTVCFRGDFSEQYKIPTVKHRRAQFQAFTKCSSEQCPESVRSLHKLAQEKTPRVMVRSLRWVATLMESGTLVVEFYNLVTVTLKDNKLNIELDAGMVDCGYKNLRNQVLQIEEVCTENISQPTESGMPLNRVNCLIKNIEHGMDKVFESFLSAVLLIRMLCVREVCFIFTQK